MCPQGQEVASKVRAAGTRGVGSAACVLGGVPGWHRTTDGYVACVLVDLASVLTPEIMAPILANADVQERLLPYLPSGESLPQTADEIQNTLTSPQFQQVCMPVALCTRNSYMVGLVP